MIDWNKPIETVDGRKARKIQTVQNELWNIVFVPGENFGDVFLINADGFICGDRTNLRQANRPFIRNVRVKRKAWIRLAIHELYKGDTKEEVEQMITNHDKYKAVYAEWEEEP